MKVFRPICVGMASLFLCFTLQAQELSVSGSALTDLTEQLFSVAPNNSATLKTYVKTASFLTLDRTKLRKLYLEQPNHFRLQVPQANGKLLELELFREDILAASFYVDDQDNNIKDYEPGLYYHGFVLENPKSLVAISLFEDKVYGVLNVEGETYVLGHMNQDRFPAGQNYVLYKKSDLLIQNDFHCATDHLPKIEEQTNNGEGDMGFSVGCKVVQIYFEADYRMFLDNGSSETETVDFITAMFNVVALLYKNEKYCRQNF